MHPLTPRPGQARQSTGTHVPGALQQPEYTLICDFSGSSQGSRAVDIVGLFSHGVAILFSSFMSSHKSPIGVPDVNPLLGCTFICLTQLLVEPLREQPC